MIKGKLKSIKWTMGIVASCVMLAAVVSVASASAEVTCASCRPWWRLSTASFPANLPPGGEGEITTLAEDRGDAGVSGSPIVLTNKLPAGLIAQSVSIGATGSTSLPNETVGRDACKIEPHEVTCTIPEGALPIFFGVDAYTHIESFVKVKVEGTGSGEEDEASITGGGAANASVRRPVVVSGEESRFGVEQYEMSAENVDGSLDTQAGSHPFQLTTGIALKQGVVAKTPPASVKDLHFDLPPGLIGNPTPFPQCPLSKFIGNAGDFQNFCPDNTVVGVASVNIALPAGESPPETDAVPLFALVPSFGEPARFGFDALGVPVYLDTSVRTGGDYGVTVSVNNITELAGFVSSHVTFWGVPGDPRHDSVRGWNCLQPQPNAPACAPFGQSSPPPLLTMPTSCTGPVHTTVQADSWQDEGDFTPPFEYVFQDNLGQPVGMDGCNQLPFTPSINVTPDGQAGSTPTGLTVGVHVPQEVSLDAEGLGEADVKDTSVVLPSGVALNPAAADGLQACTEEQVALPIDALPSCPEAAKVATLEIKSPLLPNPLTGEAYLATQNTNPFGSLVALYLVAQDPVSGVIVKIAGEVTPNPVTGQLVSTFKNTPQLPFEDLKLHFFGGDRAPLSTPSLCGAYTTVASIAPWSGNEPADSNSTFDVTTGPNETPCHDPLPFAPSLTAGTTSIQAGGFTPFTMTMSRPDGSQSLQAITLKMPPGLLGTLATVKLCKEEQANAGTCGPETLIGDTTVSVGVGGDPYTVTGGQVFITEGYGGAPYGLSIVNPAKAGPYNLGTVVVRAKIEVDPVTAALTVTTDTSGPYKIPTILDGIPLQIQHINVSIDRSNFTFNPTNCSPLSVTGSLQSSEGSTRALAVPFQVTNCAVLAFKPKLTASTNGKTSRASGASLKVRLTYPAGAYDANISKVKVDLPKQLPSKLPTLQKACPAATFNVNPAGCPAASIVGHATATTPVLPVPLSGPAYFVSHGGEAFPDLIIVLQGYGTTVHLVGSTYINEKTGITSSTFKQVPDVPVGTFELTLPQGKYSALAATANLCTTKLAMPTSFVGQNGAEIHTSTPIVPTGCAKHKTKKKHKVQKAKKGKRRR